MLRGFIVFRNVNQIDLFNDAVETGLVDVIRLEALVFVQQLQIRRRGSNFSASVEPSRLEPLFTICVLPQRLDQRQRRIVRVGVRLDANRDAVSDFEFVRFEAHASIIFVALVTCFRITYPGHSMKRALLVRGPPEKGKTKKEFPLPARLVRKSSEFSSLLYLSLVV